MLEGNVYYLIGYGGIIIKGNEIIINLCLCVLIIWYLYCIVILYYVVLFIEINCKICDLRYLFVIDLYEVIIRCRNLKGIEKGG